MKVLQMAGFAVTIIIIAIMLAGCASTGAVPSSLLTCADQPRSPAVVTQQNVGIYVVDLAEAGQDCRSKLGAVRRLVNPET